MQKYKLWIILALILVGIGALLFWLAPSQSSAEKAPTAQPSSIEATLKPVPADAELNAARSPSTVPLITAPSNPNRKPPIVATQLIRMMYPVFAPLVLVTFYLLLL